jgi:hypothetical protein
VNGSDVPVSRCFRTGFVFFVVLNVTDEKDATNWAIVCTVRYDTIVNQFSG